ncbi:hypothetical protein GGS21DRAFT_491688 [Xylaria nigripes]|nr:hypothetical protein GGS21DRAFT_491688 [Xylaria nigripes]
MQFTTFALTALSMGSAMAQPLAAVTSFTEVTTAIVKANTLIEKQVTSITSLTSGEITVDLIADVEKIVVDVGEIVGEIIEPVLGLVSLQQVKFTEAQLAGIPDLLKNTQTMVSHVQTVSKCVAVTKQKNSNVNAQTELSYVLGNTGLVAERVVKFVTVAVPTTSSVFVTVQGLLTPLEALLATLLAPITAIVGQLLATLL